MKKTLALALAVILALTLVACTQDAPPQAASGSEAPQNSPSDPAPAAPSSSQPAESEPASPQPQPAEAALEKLEHLPADPYGQYTIGFCFSNASQDSAASAFYAAAKAYSQEVGFTLVEMDAGGDATVQVNQIEDMMKQDIDVMCVWPINGTAVVPALKKCSEAGVKVVIANSRADAAANDYIVSFAGDDYIAQGRDSGQLMGQYAEQSGKEEFKVVEISHIPGYQVSAERGEGFRLGIQGTKVNLVESQTADGNREKAQSLTENFLLKYPDLDGIWIQGDNMAIGVMNAIEAAGKTGEIIVIGNSLSGEGYDRMAAGAYHGSCYQDQGEEAIWSLNTALRIANGEEVPKDNIYICPPIVPETLHLYERPSW